MALLLGSAAITSCGSQGPQNDDGTAEPSVEVVVSLYSGLENPTIQVPESEYEPILECLRSSDTLGYVSGDYGIPAFVVEDGGNTFYIQQAGVVKETASTTVSVRGCDGSFSALANVSNDQLTDEEQEFLNGE